VRTRSLLTSSLIASVTNVEAATIADAVASRHDATLQGFKSEMQAVETEVGKHLQKASQNRNDSAYNHGQTMAAIDDAEGRIARELRRLVVTLTPREFRSRIDAITAAQNKQFRAMSAAQDERLQAMTAAQNEQFQLINTNLDDQNRTALLL
jgi:hypothetical protein